ncbi:hypothetical protein MMC11_002050 [Xylographa trunciseda]|nr:hypothetical protein [Xylographa trunciseda]
MATFAKQQPAWVAPRPPDSNTQLPPLKIWNSLTRSKTAFVPINWESKIVKWYVCGPTVYNDAHLGHARNYVTTDIIRRIMRDFFGFKLNFVMNITDIDDKIILRGRQQHLLEKFVSDNKALDDTVLDTAQAALQNYVTKNLPLIDSKAEPSAVRFQMMERYKPILSGKSLDGGSAGDKEAKIKMHINTVQTAVKAIESAKTHTITIDHFYHETQDILLPYLDSNFGSSVDADDHRIFTKLTQMYEARFMEDMRALHCQDPDEVTRVTEYGQQIVDFVKKIQDNGFAYATSDGSVYFDIKAFEAAQNHYARLEPWNRNDFDLLADGEGALTKETSEKRSKPDFALWKSSKPGEPSWPSPWGRGRPGWHIECSAMASDKLGSQMDIHSGGIDLAFPHHDNELAQSEAYWTEKNKRCDHQWVNYFMHMGHLSIQGSKMSKSLKNFITIREALNRGEWTPRGLRIVFLLGNWKDGIEITDDMVKAGSAWEDKVNNFFIKAKDIVENRSHVSGGVKLNRSSVSARDVHQARNEPSAVEKELAQALDKAQKELYEALCDSFNTPLAMAIISELISVFNGLDKSGLSSQSVAATAKWVTSLVNIFGLNGLTSSKEETIGWSGVSIPEAAKSYVFPLSTVRDELRRKARSVEGLSSHDLDIVKQLESLNAGDVQKDARPYAKVAENFAQHISALKSSSSLSKDVLQLCDRLRNIDLWDQGIYLEDRDGNQPALVRPITKELLAARQEKEEKDRQKQKAKEDSQREAAAKADQGRQSHMDMFRTPEYSAWDEDGVPVKDIDGEELPKSRIKKLKKDWERQRKLHEKWAKASG